ncbi:hypothetical protein EV368DRAFT_18041, partial [Lentinula lateritia]
STPPDRLEAFQTGNLEAGPKLVNTTLHWHGLSAEQMRKSLWNDALKDKLSEEARFIVSQTNDRRFGSLKLDFSKLFRDRFNKLFRYIDNFRPQPGETADQRAMRLQQAHDRQRSSTK